MVLQLVDEGTLDTVLRCSDCGEHIRYQEADRDGDGYVQAAWLHWATDEHSDECGLEPDAPPLPFHDKPKKSATRGAPKPQGRGRTT